MLVQHKVSANQHFVNFASDKLIDLSSHHCDSQALPQSVDGVLTFQTED